MDKVDFDTWFGELTAAFPGVYSWLSKMPEFSSEEAAPTRRKVLGHWRGTLSHVTLDEARRALSAMDRGHLELPKDFGRIPAVVRRWVEPTARPFNRRVDGEVTYKCLDCMDTGFVIVWRTDAMNALKLGKFERPKHMKRMTTVCRCKQGEAQNYDGDRMRYDPRCHLPFVSCYGDDEIVKLAEFLGVAYEPKEPPNYKHRLSKAIRPEFKPAEKPEEKQHVPVCEMPSEDDTCPF